MNTLLAVLVFVPLAVCVLLAIAWAAGWRIGQLGGDD